MKTRRISNSRIILIVIIGACTCGVRPECGGRAKISLLTAIHDDSSCQKTSPIGIMMYEAAQYLAEVHNNRTSGNHIEVNVLDTCGSTSGALKAAMKALVMADINCLQPPHYLGLISPDINAEVVDKLTSVLNVPFVTRTSSDSAYIHRLPEISNEYIFEGILETIKRLRWKSFVLFRNNNGDNELNSGNIAKKLTSAAILNEICVTIPQNDDEELLTSNIVHIGKPDQDFYSRHMNSTIIVATQGKMERELNQISTTNTILLLEDSLKTEFPGLETEFKKSSWWNSRRAISYDTKSTRDVRWLQSAIKAYADALDISCDKKCRSPIASADWNNIVMTTLLSYDSQSQKAGRVLHINLKLPESRSEYLGKLQIRKNKATLYWKKRGSSISDNYNDNSAYTIDDEYDDEQIPYKFQKIISREKKSKSGCQEPTDIRVFEEQGDSEDEKDGETPLILIPEMDDSEWWIMVGTVAAVGVAMFVFGILAVYVVYSNIRGPVPKSGKHLERESSFRRAGSERDVQLTIPRKPRKPRAPPRRDSRNSITSQVSEND